MIIVVAAPSEHAAALANNTRTLAVKAVPSEHAAALADSTSMCHSGGSTIRTCSSTC